MKKDYAPKKRINRKRKPMAVKRSNTANFEIGASIALGILFLVSIVMGSLKH